MRVTVCSSNGLGYKKGSMTGYSSNAGQSEPALFTYNLRQPNPGMQRSRASSHAARRAGRRMDASPLLTVRPSAGDRGVCGMGGHGRAWAAAFGKLRHWAALAGHPRDNGAIPRPHQRRRPKHRRLLTGELGFTALAASSLSAERGPSNTVLLEDAARSGPIAEADAQCLRNRQVRKSGCRNSRTGPLSR